MLTALRNQGFGSSMKLKEVDAKSEDLPIFENKIWGLKDVSLYTGYSIGTLYNLTSKNLIPFRKKRGKLFFLPFEIQNWIEEGDLK